MNKSACLGGEDNQDSVIDLAAASVQIGGETNNEQKAVYGNANKSASQSASFSKEQGPTLHGRLTDIKEQLNPLIDNN